MLTLQEAVYRRAQETAIASGLSLEELLTQLLVRLLSPQNKDFSQHLQADQSVRSLKSDEQK